MAIDEMADVLNILDWSFFEDPHAIFARLRKEAPVFWSDPAQSWLVSKHEDIRQVLRATDVFTSTRGVVIGDNFKPQRGRGGWPEESEIVLYTDPPRHNQLRRIVSKAFTPRMVAELEPRIRQLVSDALDGVDPNGEVDFVDVLAKPIPAYVMIELLGVPRERREDFARWMEVLVAAVTDPDPEAVLQHPEILECYAWFLEALQRRRGQDGEDLISALLSAEVDGEGLSDMNLLAFCVVLLAGGLETTGNLASGAAKALTEHRDQRRRLIDQPALIPTAVGEFLRWVTPAVATARTARAATEIRGQPIAEGDYIIMLFQSGNRDEEVWERPAEFDVTRGPEPMHLAFGWGAHLCLGAALARLEVQVMFQELLARFPDYTLSGEPKRLESVLINGYTSMPVVLSP